VAGTILQPLLITPGEPAGIGPELACRAAALDPSLIVVADPELLRQTVAALGLETTVLEVDGVGADATGGIRCLPVALKAPVEPGRLDPANAAYVLECLEIAADHCLAGRVHGLVTGPVHKGVINQSGIEFSGHTEFLAGRAGVERVVMMLAAGRVRVALATTHLPLREVADAVTGERLESTLRILDQALRQQFDLRRPKIAVLGLNPHAGEGGYLGREEIDVIEPVMKALRGSIDLVGPLPADTAFVPDRLRQFDAVLAMYHDQGLPVLKHVGFGHAVNVTLGLPFIRTSVDHGTALDLAGSGKADTGSLIAAVNLARSMNRPVG
jgi:4-hydroxythreonine-4-phosphate dehydrogenase